MSTSNKLFLAALILNIVAVAYMPPLPLPGETTYKIGEFTLSHGPEPGSSEYISLPMALFVSSIGLFIAGLKLRKH